MPSKNADDCQVMPGKMPIAELCQVLCRVKQFARECQEIEGNGQNLGSFRVKSIVFCETTLFSQKLKHTMITSV